MLPPIPKSTLTTTWCLTSSIEIFDLSELFNSIKTSISKPVFGSSNHGTTCLSFSKLVEEKSLQMDRFPFSNRQGIIVVRSWTWFIRMWHYRCRCMFRTFPTRRREFHGDISTSRRIYDWPSFMTPRKCGRTESALLQSRLYQVFYFSLVIFSPYSGTFYPTSMKIRPDGRLVVRFKTVARFTGMFVLEHPGRYNSRIVENSRVKHTCSSSFSMSSSPFIMIISSFHF